MQIIDAQLIERFAKRYASARKPLARWTEQIRNGRFANSQAIKEQWSTASFLSGTRVVFNIGGNEYRLFVEFDYQGQRVTVLAVGTHQEYDKWNLQSN